MSDTPPQAETNLVVAGPAHPASPQKLRLWVFHAEQVIPFDLPISGAVTIGRAPENDLVVDAPSVSRRHAVLRLGAALELEDLGSANGTRVHGVRLASGESVRVRAGEAFEVGAVMIVVQPSGPGSARASPLEAGPAAPPLRPAGLVVHDPVMHGLHALLERVAVTDISLLLLGETGVGKEIFARRLHELSPQGKGPFLALNCAAFSETLLESEIFGYEKGAFTGAASAKPGLFESAAGGTVFLDELGELPLSIQAKLLRAVETRTVRRLGGLRDRPIDVRFVSATNRDLEAEVQAGRFRADLFFRIDGFAIVIPPLRERVTEIEDLARAFAARAAGSRMELTPEALDVLRGHRWPGNVRELARVMERAVLLAGSGPITPAVLERCQLVVTTAGASTGPGRASALVAAPESTAPAAPPGAARPLVEELAALERARMVTALEETGWVKTRAAELIRMPLRTFLNKLKRHAIVAPASASKPGPDDEVGED